jgi:predicted GIY-YIG superfamily endonuclease
MSAARRICEHDCDSTRQEIHSRRHTRDPWKLIYCEGYLEQSDARGRETYLKNSAGRRFLQSQLKNYLRKHLSKEAA